MLLLLRAQLNGRVVSWSKQEGAKVFVRTHLSHTFYKNSVAKTNHLEQLQRFFEGFLLFIVSKVKNYVAPTQKCYWVVIIN